MKLSIWFDFHDTIVDSSKAWLKAYKYYCSKKEYRKISFLYKKGYSRKKLANMVNIDYYLIENKYREYLKTKRIITWLLYYCINKYDVIIISNASRKRILKDLEKVKINCDQIKLYTKENGHKPEIKYINNIIKDNNIDEVIMIGNDKFEDNFKQKKINTVIIKNIFSESYAVLLILYYRIKIRRNL